MGQYAHISHHLLEKQAEMGKEPRVRDRQTYRARDARLIATGLGEDCWPRESPIAFANSLIQAPAKLARRSSDMLRRLADLQLLRDERERGLGHFIFEAFQRTLASRVSPCLLQALLPT